MFVRIRLRAIFLSCTLASLLLVLDSSLTIGQSNGVPGGLSINGQSIIAGTDGGWFATSSTIYYERGNNNFFFDINLERFHFNPPSTITSISKKGPQSALVLLSDGSVHLISYNSGAKELVEKNLPPNFQPGSQSWKKIAGDAIYRLSSSALYVTRDTGTTWQVDSAGLQNATVWDFALDTLQYVYAATTNGLFVQHPDTNIWHKVNSFTQAANLYRVFVDRKNRILVGGNGGELYFSTNGSTWSTDTGGIGNQWVNLIADDALANLYVVTRNPFTNIDQIYRSSSGTSSWQEIDGSLNSITVNNTAINSLLGDTLLAAETSFGLFLSTDQGTTWVPHNNNITAETFTGFLKSQTGTWFTTTSMGLFSKNPSDTSWTKSYPLTGFANGVAVTGDAVGDIFAGSTRTPAGGPILFRSTDNGTSWSADTAGISILRTGIYALDESGGQHLGTSQWGSSYPSLLFTKPLGGSWTRDTAGFQSTVYSFSYSIASDKHGYLYVTGSYFNGYGGAQVNARVMRRPIGGGPWVPDTTGLPTSVNYLSRLAPDKSGNMMGIAGSSLYRRTNGTWGTVSLPTQVVSNFYSFDKFSTDSSGALFASFTNFSGGRGVYFTTNGGTSWTFAGLDSLSITQLISYGDSTYASTLNGLYILRRQAAGTTGVTKNDVHPMTYQLFQNYPNPFNPTTTISFQLAAVSKLNLKIYDLLGREVETLLDGEMNAGMHQVTFDAAKFSSGIYFCRLQAGSFTATKKLLLLK